jgi:hypothetical protein
MAVLWVATLVYLTMEAVQTSETSVNSYQSTRRYNLEDGHLDTGRLENLRAHFMQFTNCTSLYGCGTWSVALSEEHKDV